SFLFQAEDGIRDDLVTGVQTCALPISKRLPFLQAKRLLAVTPVRVIGDAIFDSIRYDALLVDEGPRIPLPLLVACACLARERIVLAGNPHELPPPSPTPYGVSLGWPTSLSRPPAAPAQPAPA